MKKIELLAPAGDLERLKIAILYGADAVYIGGQDYSLRANANNFSIEEMRDACTFAHSYHKKVYLTLNIVFHNEDLDGVRDYIDKAVGAGIDAFIVSDPSIISIIKEKYPQVEVHISTQNSTSNSKAVEFFKKQGANRVVLARELTKEQIKNIIEKTKVDMEVFIHGAMCTCFSGRCTLSNYVTNRDANRGGCAQVCRFTFQDSEVEKANFTMALKDLNMSNYIRDMIEIGVTSLKVEGRMRSVYYLATVIGAYRKIIDYYLEDSKEKELLSKEQKSLANVSNRETSAHYFPKENNFSDEFSDQYYTGRQEISNQDYLGLIIDYDDKNKRLILKEKNFFSVGDQVELFTPSLMTYSFTVEEIYDENLDPIQQARHPEETLQIPFHHKVEPFSMLRLIKKGQENEQ